MPKLLLPLVALALAGGGAGAYLWLTSAGGEEEVVRQPATETPTPTITATSLADDWAAYVDPELGFSFPHPRQSTLIDESPPGAKEGGAGRLLSLRDPAGQLQVSIAILADNQGLALGDWVKENYPCASDAPSGPVPAALEAISIAGEAGLMCPYDTLSQPNPVIYVEHGGNVFVVTGNTGGRQPGITEDNFQRLIHGFAFER